MVLQAWSIASWYCRLGVLPRGAAGLEHCLMVLQAWSIASWCSRLGALPRGAAGLEQCLVVLQAWSSAFTFVENHCFFLHCPPNDVTSIARSSFRNGQF